MLQCRTDDDDDEQLKIELLSQWKLEAEFRNNDTIMMMIVMTEMINNVARYMQYTEVESVNH